MSPTSLPLFPLPSVVLFPSVFLPLHIFEARYRQMVSDALAGDRVIGITLLKPGFEAQYDQQPPIYATGCSGLITHAERLPDGRFNVILHGLDKFAIAEELAPVPGQLYRRARVEPSDERLSDVDRDALRDERKRLEDVLTPLFDGALEHRLPSSMPDDDLVNALAQYLDFEPLEKQALLEQPGPLARCRSMAELLEMKTLLRKTPGLTGKIH